ncbi:MAG: hypothetical protein QOK48_1225 [Blastocatellia bacterium]|jgi:hypothetical protein|nr:hypothetical protein [Blastocatellia bacterium]
MSKPRFALLLLVLLFIFGLSGRRSAQAQSTLLNVPSTDVVAARKVYVEMDFLTNYAWQRQGSFQNYIPRAVIGLGRNVEVGANLSYTHVAGETSPLELQPNIKWQVYSNEENGTALAVGCILYAPITHRAGTNTLGQCYSTFSKQMRGRFGPRFTVGPYMLLHATEDERTKAGAIIGYQQPLARKVSLIVDWYSGDNRLGYVSSGLSFITSTNSSLTTGYTVANHGRGKNALFAYYGIQF